MQDFIILETTARPLGGSFDTPGSLAEAVGAGGPRLDVAPLTAPERAQMERDARFLVAPKMPTALIRPLDVAATPAAGGTAWGIEAVKADVTAATGAGVKVAVLDTGIDAAHPAFAGVTLTQKDFSGDGDGDRQGHGTHCAGTIFGRDVDGTRIGIARGVTDVLIGKVLRDNGAGESDMIFQAMQWAMNQGAQVISMSLGFDFPGMVARLVGQGWPADLATSEALEAYRGNLRMFDALMAMIRAQAAFGASPVVVAAAGNESRRDQNQDYRIAKSLPAAAQDVLAIAAASAGTPYGIAYFSNSLASLTAPGVDILSARAGGGLATMSGTSMACPHVAGVAALWWQNAVAGGQPHAATVIASLVANARGTVFAAGLDEADYGGGMVTAP